MKNEMRRLTTFNFPTDGGNKTPSSKSTVSTNPYEDVVMCENILKRFSNEPT